MVAAHKYRLARVAAIAVLAAFAIRCAGHARSSAGFWFEERAFTLPADTTSVLGGPLRPEDIDEIEQAAFLELPRIFSGLNVDMTHRQDAVWRVSVVKNVQVQGGSPAAGGSIQLGGFGGRGSVGFVTLATTAVRYAPAGISRHDLLHAIGLGIARAAAHEFAHQMLGGAMPDDKTNSDSYEYFSADRASQYFGTLRWVAAWPLLQKKLNR